MKIGGEKENMKETERKHERVKNMREKENITER